MPEPDIAPEPVPPVPPITPPTVTPQGFVPRAQYESDMTKARSDEKQKQFDRIKLLEEELTRLKGEHNMLQTQFDALNKSQSQEGKVDTKKLIEEVTTAANKLHETNVSSLTKELERLRGEVSNERLERFRQKAITDAGGPEKLVVSLVRGSSEEEISASIAEAKAEYESIAKRFAPPVTTPSTTPANSQNPVTVTPPPPIVPARSGGEGREAGEGLLDSPGAIKKLRSGEYKERREQIQQELKARYPRKAVGV